jgi:hypothetical protein
MYVFMLTERWSEEARPLRLRDYLAFITAAVLAACLIYLVAGACPALAQDVIPGAGDPVPIPDGSAANAASVVLLVIGIASRAVGYLVNFVMPQTSEQVKQVVQLVLAAGLAALYTVIQSSDGLDVIFTSQTLWSVLTAMLASVGAHVAFKQGNLNTFLGGGLNRQAGDKLFVKT